MKLLCKHSKYIRVCVFVVLFILLLNSSSKLVATKGEFNEHAQYEYETVYEFYKEIPNTLDAVYLGASHVYMYWLAPIAWKQTGITVYPLSTSSQPMSAVPFLIEEARKTQPQALIIANVNQLVMSGATSGVVHNIADFFPLSMTKINMVQYLYNVGDGRDAYSIMEFFFPLLRFHTRWKGLTWKDFHFEETLGLKGVRIFDDFLSGKNDMTSNFMIVDKKEPLAEYGSKVLNDILNYCDREKVNILFVIVPQFTEEESRTAQYNTAKDYIESRGYPVLDMMDHFDEIGLDLSQDYVGEDGKHTNLHGAIKVTEFLSQYLLDHYDFPEKTGGGGTRAGTRLTTSIKRSSHRI